MAKKDLYGLCPYVTSQKILSGKWSIYLLYLLQEGPVRFNELQRKMPEDITHTTLSRQLKSLEEEGLIIRREYSQIPPRVEYSLSEIGLKFESVLEALRNWGSDYIEFVKHKNHTMEKDGEAI
ncbi:winged helix-turn-helix transcriptional regulator [Lacrimispora sp.]|uniref:winged helix-turn-helix transcriptional regulator n=1 Tax=Lacrimispora sp. TaxID=2719234 RepID=UPI0028AB01CA|nr:helix-turn-helix domain-containing protein [Lacrimispora sp.]